MQFKKCQRKDRLRRRGMRRRGRNIAKENVREKEKGKEKGNGANSPFKFGSLLEPYVSGKLLPSNWNAQYLFVTICLF